MFHPIAYRSTAGVVVGTLVAGAILVCEHHPHVHNDGSPLPASGSRQFVQAGTAWIGDVYTP
jgi:hypothetical protein